MGKIVTSTTGIDGVKHETIVRTNQFEDFVINTIGRLFGEEREWRLVHFVEKLKLKRQR